MKAPCCADRGKTEKQEKQSQDSGAQGQSEAWSSREDHPSEALGMGRERRAAINCWRK